MFNLFTAFLLAMYQQFQMEYTGTVWYVCSISRNFVIYIVYSPVMAVSSTCQSHVEYRGATFSLGDFYFFTKPPPPNPLTGISLFSISNPTGSASSTPSLFGVHYFFKSLTGEGGRRGCWRGDVVWLLTLTPTFWQLLFRAQRLLQWGNWRWQLQAHTHQHFIGSRRGVHFTPGFSINVLRVHTHPKRERQWKSTYKNFSDPCIWYVLYIKAH